MLEELAIKDFALIDTVSLEFAPGFTALTGETGAGKSILIGALSFLLGGKADTGCIRTGAEEARVSGVFSLDRGGAGALEWLSDHGIDSEDNRVRLRRAIRVNGKNGAWIESAPVTRAELADFAALLTDIHGQRDHESLLRSGEHRRSLDEFAGISGETARFTLAYSDLVKKREELAALEDASLRRDEKIEMLRYAVEEIAGAKLKPGEEEELTQEEKRLNQYEKLYAAVEEALGLLSGDLLSGLKKLNALLDQAAGFDEALKGAAKRCEAGFYEYTDIAEDLRAYSRGLVFDPERLNAVEERLALLFKLRKKYPPERGKAGGIEGVIAYGESAQGELERLSRSEENQEALKAEIGRMERALYLAAKNLSQKRRAASTLMASGVESVLAKLGMGGARFVVSITEKESAEFDQKCGPYGIDNVEFLFSANPGVPEKPLNKIASGGELSRVMLALKTVFAGRDSIDTLVFDEIDTGIGGEVSVSVGAHLKQLSKNKQILCITHLASIAVYADTQMKVEKRVAGNRTATSVRAVTGEERTAEIGRMLSGDPGSAQSLDHARALLQKYT
ncbi:MAG: DNA repair protein RecN [Spirochaetaceae bacterium]|jgi:DNA repair protein RecN (Recombination protein N)|nr:DNA repair protein RecN [Spirochaetaceae bacterium]